jgi:[ribosomal protein S5]-alanine N-acetyltransferase
MTFSTALKSFPELKTKRLTLRQITDADAAAYYGAISALPHTSAWRDSGEAQSLKNTHAAIRSYNNYFKRAKTIIPWVVVDQNADLAGFVKLFDIQYRSKAEIGYWLAEPLWGKGLMPEAIEAVVTFAFDQLGLHRIYATTHVDNRASQRVLEKVGFKKEGVLRMHGRLQGKWADSVMYGLLNTDR